MPFPETSILDDFNRANENPLSGGGNWSGPLRPGTGQLTLTANQASGSGSSYWAASFAANMECYASFASAPAGTTELWVRASGMGTTSVSGYRAFYIADFLQLDIQRVDNDSDTAIATTTLSFATGDQIGIEVRGSIIKVFKNGSEVLSASDTTYASSGNIGFGFGSMQMDNFGGGALGDQNGPDPVGVKTAVINADAITGTGSQAFTKAGFGRPKAAILILSNAQNGQDNISRAKISVGVTDGVKRYCISVRSQHNVTTTMEDSFGASNTLLALIENATNNLDAKADFGRWVTDGIEIDWSNTPSVAKRVTVILFGGQDFQGKVVESTLSTTQNAVTSVTGVGFQPDILLGICRYNDPFADTVNPDVNLFVGLARNASSIVNISNNIYVNDNETTSDPRSRYQSESSNRFLKYPRGSSIDVVGAEVTEFNADGWKVTTRDESSGPLIYAALAMKFTGLQTWIGTLQQPDGTGTITVTDPGFKPQLVFHCGGTNVDDNRNIGSAAGAFYISAVASDVQGCHGISVKDGSGTTDTSTRYGTSPFDVAQGTGSIAYVAAFNSFLENGFSYDYSTVIMGAHRVATFALEEFVPPSPPSGGGAHRKLGNPISIGL